MKDEENLALVRKPSNAVEKTAPRAKRILSDMVSGALVLVKKFRIGEYEWCEPDYQQLLLWAKDARTPKTPAEIVESLVRQKSVFLTGRLVEVNWDDGSIQMRRFRFMHGLRMKTLHVLGGARAVGIISTYKSSEVSPMDFEVSEIRLEGLAELEVLALSSQSLKELDLRHTPRLKKLYCEANVLSRVDLSHCQSLEKIALRANNLTELDLSNLHALKSLECHQNELWSLDLAGVPALEQLDCRENQIEVLDITPIKNLQTLKFDADKTRLLKRPDQNF